MYCTVVTASKSTGIGNGLTYQLEKQNAIPGLPVRVPLRNRMVEGIILDVSEEKRDEEYDFKNIRELLGDTPLLSPFAIETVRWMAKYYYSSLRQALSVWLPPLPWSKVLPKNLVGYRLLPGEPPELRGKKQQAVVEFLRGRDWVSRDELMQETGASGTVIAGLLERALIIEEFRKEEKIAESQAESPLLALPLLTPAQEAVEEAMRKDPLPSLLFGVTGSGKTEIYAKMIADTVREGKQAILLLPEILLTENFIDRFQTLLRPDAISVIHSRLTEAQRRNEWKKVHAGKISLVIGSRSALFAPLQKLGLVIIDEEHEWTYKNEQAPRYHARDTAEALCKFAGAKLVLGSATPSVESWARAKSGRYHLTRLPMRYKEQPLPSVRVVDLADVLFGSYYPLSPSLINAIRDRLEKKEQTVLFLNRRGVSSAILCMQCRRRIVCPESQLPYTLHHAPSGRPYLLDHTTGLVADVPALCPRCGSPKLQGIGAGTQRLEILLQHLFPGARLIRADRDTIQHPEDMRSLLYKMRNGEADILLGTQSVVKGLDLPNVTLAAVLIADIGLSLPHFRAGERVFQLLTQLTGRSGRAKPGEVIIQTFRPESPEVLAAAKHETEKYLDTELKIRLYSGYPPATRMVRLIIRGENPGIEAKKVHASVIAAIHKTGSDVKATVAPTIFGGGKIWHVLLRGSDPVQILEHIKLGPAIIDVDPMETV